MKVAELFKSTHSDFFQEILERCEVDTNVRGAMVLIKPETAKKMLSRNIPNRRVKFQVVVKYARSMSKGEWTKNGEPIIFDCEGKMIEGQHRLTACLKAGTSFWSMVVYGVDSGDRTKLSINDGSTRKASDHLQMAYGAKQANLATAVSSLILRARVKFLSRNAKGGFSKWEIADAYLQNKEAIHSAILGSKSVYETCAPSHSVTAYVLLRLREIDREWADEFFAKLAGEAQSIPGEPAWKLRRKLQKLKNSREVTVIQGHLLFMFFTAWNADRANKNLRGLTPPQPLSIPDPI